MKKLTETLQSKFEYKTNLMKIVDNSKHRALDVILQTRTIAETQAQKESEETCEDIDIKCFRANLIQNRSAENHRNFTRAG